MRTKNRKEIANKDPRKIGRREFLKTSGTALGALGVASLFPGYHVHAAEPIKVGCQAQFTGVLANEGLDVARGERAAANWINEHGGVGGRELQLIFEDSESKPLIGVRVMRKLIQRDGVSFVFGAHNSGISLATNPIALELKTLYFPHGSATDITGKRGNPYVFRLLHSVRHEVLSSCWWAVENVGKRWSLVGLDYAWGQDQVKSWGDEVERLGGKAVDRILVPLGTDNMLPYLSRIKAGETEVLAHYFFGQSALAFIKQAKELGILGKVKIFGVYDSVENIDPAPFEGGYFYTSYPQRADEVPDDLKPFDKELRKAVGVDDAGYYKDSTNISGMGHIWVGWEHPFLLKEGIEKSGWKSKKDDMDLIRALQGIRLKAGMGFPQGDKFIRAEDHQCFHNMYVQQVRNGAYRTVLRVPPEKALYPPEGNHKV